MATPIATVDVSDYLSNHWYGVIYEPPVITRSLGSGDGVTGFVEVNDIEWEMFPSEASGALGSLLRKWIRDEYQGHVVKAIFREPATGLVTTEWFGTIEEDWLIEHGGVHLKGAGFPFEALEQRIPTPVISLDDFPGAVDVGKTPPYIIGACKKLRCLYIDDRGPYDYIYMLGLGPATTPTFFRDALNQGAITPGGAQSFEAVNPASMTLTNSLIAPVSGYQYCRVRFASRQVNSQGSLVGIYADFEGDTVSRPSPITTIATILTNEGDGLYGATIDAASFNAARTKFAALTAPWSISVDCVIGADQRPVAITDLVRPILQMCNGYLGMNESGQITISIDGPPSTIAMAVGAGPGIAENNISSPGVRRRRPLAQRSKRLVMDYGYDQNTGAYLYQRSRSLQTKGRDIPVAMNCITQHRTADIVVDRLAKIELNSQDMIEGTVVASHQAWSLNEGDLILYTWQPHGCEEEIRKIVRVRKELGSVTIDHRAYNPNEWQYDNTIVIATPPPIFVPPPNDPPPAPPTPGDGTTLIEDSGTQRIDTAEIPEAISGSYIKLWEWALTVNTTGNDLKYWGFVEVVTQAVEVGGEAGNTWVRLRNITTGQQIEVGPIAMTTRQDLFPGYTVYYATFPSTSLQRSELGVSSGSHTIYMEVKTSPAQTIFCGSSDQLTVGWPSNGYMRVQEWS